MVFQHFEKKSTRIFVLSLPLFLKEEECPAPVLGHSPEPLREEHLPQEPRRCTTSHVSPGPQDWQTEVVWGFWMCKETLLVSRASLCFDAEEVGNGRAHCQWYTIRTMENVPFWYCRAAFLHLQDVPTCQTQEKSLFSVILHVLLQINLLAPGRMYNPSPKMRLLFHAV